MRRLVFLIPFAVALLAIWWLVWHRGPLPLVVYCAHDSIYAEKILRDFERQSGVSVAIRFDTEATKSLGLVELLLREKDAPRCDVFWNNELLAMLDLTAQGVLEPYRGAGFARMPGAFKDPAGCWTGFAARMRVIIYNPIKLPHGPETGLFTAFASGDPSRLALAKPLYGTTLTHYSALWKAWGAEKTIAWDGAWRARGVREFNGNAAVKDAVAGGACDAGFTDTDDFFEAKDAGANVAMQPVRLDNGQVVCIPNTVGIIHGTRRLHEAQQLVEFLLSESTELALAHSNSRQIPLGPISDDALPPEVRELRQWSKDAVPLIDLGPAREACLAWLKAQYLR